MYSFDFVKEKDKELADAISKEIDRQCSKIELIASENIVSKAVMAAMGSPLTNKYAEGYPGKRYYGGCEFVDVAETLAIKRAKKLFDAQHANVQPHSGAQANNAVYFAFLDPGDTIMGMNLTHGGHLTHGSPVNISGKYYNIIPYGVSKEDERIDIDALRKLAIESKPKLIVAGASAYSRVIDYERFREVADEVGAYLMVDMAHIAGLIAAKLHPNPCEHAHFVTTTTHKTLRGPRGGMILCKEEYAKAVDKAVFPGIQGGPLMHTIAAKAVSFKEALSDEFITYSKQTIKNAKALASSLIDLGYKIVSGGTDNHMMLVSLSDKGITGKEAQINLDEVNITTNKNSIPFDTLSPFVTSGIRLGTPAVTTRGFTETDMQEVAQLIHLTLSDFDNNKNEVIRRVRALTDSCPFFMENNN